MDVYDNLLRAADEEFTRVRLIKRSERGSVSLLRHPSSGNRYLFRQFEGAGEVYRRLLELDCPHLPLVYEVAEREGRTLVLEEYVQGDSLSYLLRGAVLTADEARDVARQLCAALWVLHSMGAVHRDIKPENVIIRGGEAVLVDFDAARIYKFESESDTRILGTTGYAAPEQYGISQSDSRADIYSLGVLLNVMLTGSHPSRETVRGHLGRVVQKCTMTSPGKRYKNVRQLMEAL